jgi:hypothetical protein
MPNTKKFQFLLFDHAHTVPLSTQSRHFKNIYFRHEMLHRNNIASLIAAAPTLKQKKTKSQGIIRL